MRRITLSGAGSVIALLALTVSALIIHHQLREVHYREVMATVRSVPGVRVQLALALTLLSYALLTLYDTLGLRYVRHPLPYLRSGFASFTSYAVTNTVGLSLLTGVPLRVRYYSAWGLSGTEIAKLVAFCYATFWLGLLTIGGLALILEPVELPGLLHLPLPAVVLGGLMLVLPTAYLLVSGLMRKPLRLRSAEIELPPLRLSLAQLAVGVLDWCLAGAVLWMVLPAGLGLSFPLFLGVFVLGQTAGVISHVPGGLGVFETILLVTLSPHIGASAVAGSLVVYRLIYYFAPLGLAAALIGVHEISRASSRFLWIGRLFGQWVPSVVPNLLAISTFLAGVILLFSGATPSVHSRMAWLDRFLPLPIIEFSHFLGSVVGTVLLLIARGLQRRLDAAYYLTAFLLGAGIVLSLLKGLDFEEAIILAVMLAALLPCHRYFRRKSSLTSPRFSPGWIAAIGLTLGASLWLGFFSYKHVAYTQDLWWRFGLLQDAPRFLRATTAATVLALLYGLSRLMKSAVYVPAPPTGNETMRVREITHTSPHTVANLALLGDKSLLFSQSSRAFIMYGVEGRSWVALGGPIGPDAEHEELVWQFRERCERFGGWPCFYQVSAGSLPLYVDLGLDLVKLGEEARVALGDFVIEGRARKNLRHSWQRVVDEGYVFELLPASEFPRIEPDLKAISDAWLISKHTREKGFSLGRFEPSYLQHFPIAVARRQGRVMAFANVWTSGGGEELSVDLMRHVADAHKSVMDFLFIELMLWGKQQGYRWFNLGMAPFSGIESRATAPLWAKAGALVFRYGEHFYNFQGLRAYKEKYAPVWEPRYLASPGGLVLPVILTNIAALIAGGAKGVIAK
jgi:phosphatidylglycerol lysyltransferase